MNDLDNDSPQYIEPINGLTKDLYPHQRSSLYAMLDFEQNGKYIEKGGYRYYFNFNWGILANKVASGKSHIIPSLVQSGLCESEIHISMGTGLSNLTATGSIQNITTASLLIVPHNIYNQWKEVLEEFSYLTWIGLRNLRDIKNILTDEDKNIDFNPYSLVLLNINCYRQYYKYFDHCIWNRIFIDEIQTTSLTFNPPHSRFTWLITATPDQFLFRNKQSILGKRLWGGGNSTKIPKWLGQQQEGFIVKCKDSYIDQSLVLPSAVNHHVNCRNPEYIGSLSSGGIFDQSEIVQLSQGNIKYFSDKYSITVDNTADICHHMGRRLKRQIGELEIKVKHYSQYIDNDNDNQSDIAYYTDKYEKYSQKLEEYKSKYNDLIKRIDNQWCNICADDFSNSQVTTICCGQSFCFSCLFHTMRSCNKCPVCRKTLNNQGGEKPIFYMNNSKLNVDELLQSLDINLDDSKLDKVSTIIKLLQSAEFQNSKVLIFFPNSFSEKCLLDKLHDCGLTFSQIKGSIGKITKTIDLFTKGQINVLGMNANHYGSGMNLQMADKLIIYHQLDTDIQAQVVGRAQRPGRSKPLEIYHLLYEHEY